MSRAVTGSPQPGQARCGCPIGSLGAVGGGIVTAVLDAAMSSAAQSVLHAGVELATVELRVLYASSSSTALVLSHGEQTALAA